MPETDTGCRTEIHVLNNACQLISASTIQFDRINEPAEAKEKSTSPAQLFAS